MQYVGSYHRYNEIKQDWLTTKELFPLLSDKGFAANNLALDRWEKAGIIPPIKRVLFKGNPWRVFTKDGTDFQEIFNILERKEVKRVYIRRKKDTIENHGENVSDTQKAITQ